MSETCQALVKCARKQCPVTLAAIKLGFDSDHPLEIIDLIWPHSDVCPYCGIELNEEKIIITDRRTEYVTKHARNDIDRIGDYNFVWRQTNTGDF